LEMNLRHDRVPSTFARAGKIKKGSDGGAL
jgi:hypothetical protein